jgi:hypothetical protein
MKGHIVDTELNIPTSARTYAKLHFVEHGLDPTTLKMVFPCLAPNYPQRSVCSADLVGA